VVKRVTFDDDDDRFKIIGYKRLGAKGGGRED
jgi:hypothetical protein